jgi:hypothetical protein
MAEEATMRVVIAVALAAVGLALWPGTLSGAQQTSCRFVQGFATLRELVGAAKVGNCLEDERINPENGNTEQRTSGGLLVWRTIDNIAAFTDGATTWVNGPNGLQTRPNSERFAWERDPVRAGGPTAAASPAPRPAASQPASSPQPIPVPAAPAMAGVETPVTATLPPPPPQASPAAAVRATATPTATTSTGTSATRSSDEIGERDPNAGVEPLNLTTCPGSHPIKGDQGSREDDDWIYHTPQSRSYRVTQPERCFATEGEARAAGYRASEE